MAYLPNKSRGNTVSRKGPRSAREAKGTLTPLQAHFIGHLKWLLDLKEQCKQDPDCEEWKLKAVDRAAFSTFRDCERHGLAREAKNLLIGHRVEQAPAQ